MSPFKEQLQHHQEQINHFLSERLQAVTARFPTLAQSHIKHLLDASCYSVENGGKRIRPALVYGAAKAITTECSQAALDALAASVEIIHCYSLIHDDLPAMDDDDLRRGKPSCHKAFGEATAILAGDGLQTLAFELIASAPDLSDQQRVEAVLVLSQAAGNTGMVGGQAIDIKAENAQLNLDELSYMHSLKTGALINAALQLGAIGAKANNTQRNKLKLYGDATGLAFQIADDVLDVQGNTESLGKTTGKDAANNKPTYVSLLGLEKARAIAEQQRLTARKALIDFNDQADFLRNLADYIVWRNS